jgi:ABC-type lipoprotein export system ATPase subunit
MIRLRGMHKTYRTGKVSTKVLRGIDLDIEEGELVAIIGPSGSGKTTLLHAIGGLDSDYTGKVEVDGKDLHKLSDVELSDYRNRTVGFVFQHFYLLPHLSCLENVTLPHVFSRADQMPDGDLRKRGMEVLEQVDLVEKAEDPPTTLSGGQRQRVAIARALFNRPRLLLCDEPTGNLDSKLGASILALFRELNEEQGITVLIVTHDPNIAAAARRQVVVMDGKLDGAAAEADPEHVEAAQEVGQ